LWHDISGPSAKEGVKKKGSSPFPVGEKFEAKKNDPND
jgi:hypothetical protein